MGQHMGPRPYDRHIPLQDIKDLRHLVEVGLPHKITKRILPGIVLRRLHLVRILIHVHRPELIKVKILTVQTRPLLLEEDRSRALYLDQNPHDRENQQCRNQEHQHQQQVEGPFLSPVHRILQRILIGRVHLQIVHLLTFQVQSQRLR